MRRIAVGSAHAGQRRRPSAVGRAVQGAVRKAVRPPSQQFGGHISAARFDRLWEQGVQLVTAIRRNMQNRLMPLVDKILLRKRSLIEAVNDQLKNITQIEHTRHRSPANFVVNLLAGLISYTLQPKNAQPTHERPATRPTGRLDARCPGLGRTQIRRPGASARHGVRRQINTHRQRPNQRRRIAV